MGKGEAGIRDEVKRDRGRLMNGRSKKLTCKMEDEKKERLTRRKRRRKRYIMDEMYVELYQEEDGEEEQ